MEYKIKYSSFRCEYQDEYTFAFDEDIPDVDVKILKKLFIIRNGRETFINKKYITENIENIVFLVLNEGAALFSCINSNSTNKGLERYYGVYISNQQLKLAWYCMDNIIWNYVDKIDCLEYKFFTEKDLMFNHSEWSPCADFTEKVRVVTEKILHKNAIRSFAIGYQLDTFASCEGIDIFDCDDSKEERTNISKISFEELAELFEIQYVSSCREGDISLSMWQPDFMKKLRDKKYKELCKKVKEYEKKKDVFVCGINIGDAQDNALVSEKKIFKTSRLIEVMKSAKGEDDNGIREL